MQFENNGNKHKNISYLLLALMASAAILGGCGGDGGGVFFDSEDPTTTANATNATPTATTPGLDATPAPSATPTPGAAPTPTPGTGPTPTPTPTPTPSAGSIGKSLWAKNCASCHGGDTGKGTNASKTLTAIRNNTGGMGFLSGSIGANEASQIATYAASPGFY